MYHVFLHTHTHTHIQQQNKTSINKREILQFFKII